MRICSLLPAATEIVAALGLVDALVGVSGECDYPPEVRRKPVVVRARLPAGVDATRPGDQAAIDRWVAEASAAGESLYELDLAALESLRPDLVLTQDVCEVCAIDTRHVARALARLPSRPEVLALHAHRLADVLADIVRVGEAVGRPGTTGAVVDGLRRRLAAVGHRTRGTHRRRVVCLEWLDPLFVAGHWVPEMVALAGGEDALARPGEPSRRVAWDEVLAAEPEVLVVMPCGYGLEAAAAAAAALRERPGFAGLPAARAGQVWAVDASAHLSRPGPRLVDGVEVLAGILAAQEATGVDFGGRARRLA